jgi:hypothetical protein
MGATVSRHPRQVAGVRHGASLAVPSPRRSGAPCAPTSWPTSAARRRQPSRPTARQPRHRLAPASANRGGLVDADRRATRPTTADGSHGPPGSIPARRRHLGRAEPHLTRFPRTQPHLYRGVEQDWRTSVRAPLSYRPIHAQPLHFFPLELSRRPPEASACSTRVVRGWCCSTSGGPPSRWLLPQSWSRWWSRWSSWCWSPTAGRLPASRC